MSDDYTPTTDEVRQDFGYPWEGFKPDKRGRLAAFDRWLVEHYRQVAETAWDEAARAVIEFEESVISDHPTNPYRSIALLGVQEESKA